METGRDDGVDRHKHLGPKDEVSIPRFCKAAAAKKRYSVPVDPQILLSVSDAVSHFYLVSYGCKLTGPRLPYPVLREETEVVVRLTTPVSSPPPGILHLQHGGLRTCSFSFNQSVTTQICWLERE